MKILGIESSCDETAASVIHVDANNSITMLSRVTATSLTLHAKTGGIIPEIAARNQIKDIIPVVYQALEQAGLLHQGVARVLRQAQDKLVYPEERGERQDPGIPAIDAIAVTYGPGLIGSLLVGVETVKTLSYVWDIPLIPVNHLLAHLYVNWLVDKPVFPAIGLIVSGGHTDLVLMKSHKEIIWLGGTRDDAAGEAFDKTGRMLGIAYPAGPTIEKLAEKGNPKAYHFPRPLMYDKELDFSFSGLKTAVLREVELLKGKAENVKREENSTSPLTVNPLPLADLCRGVQDAIIDVLVYKTLQAAKQFQAKSIILGGGVAANQALIKTLKQTATNNKTSAGIFVPEKSLCTDNGTMIACTAVFQNKTKVWQNLTADPELYFE